MPTVLEVRGGVEIRSKLRDIASLKFDNDFKTMFSPEDPGHKVLLDDIKTGYDPNYPISIWEEEDTVLDGHRRIGIMKSLGRDAIPVAYYSFATKDEARWWAISKQIGRRNLDAKERDAFYKLYGKHTPPGHHERRGNRHTKAEHSRSRLDERLLENNSGRYTKEDIALAEKVGQKPAVVHKELSIQRNADPLVREAYLAGAMTLNGAYQAACDDKNARAGKQIPVFVPRDRKQNSTDAAPAVGRSATPPPEIKRAIASAPLPKSGKEVLNAEREFMAKIALRAELSEGDGASTMDNDIRIFLMLEPMLKQIKEDVRNLLGPCSEEWLGPLHRAVFELVNTPHPSLWQLCRKCDGKMVIPGEGTCKKCRGCGYRIN